MLQLAEDPLLRHAFYKEFFLSKLKCKWGNSVGTEREFSFNWPTQRDTGKHQGHAVTRLWVDYRGKIRLMLRTWEYLTKAADINHWTAKRLEKLCADGCWATALSRSSAALSKLLTSLKRFHFISFITFHLYSTIEKRGKETAHLLVKVLKPWPPAIRSSTLIQASWGGRGVLCGYLTCPNPLLLCDPVWDGQAGKHF